MTATIPIIMKFNILLNVIKNLIKIIKKTIKNNFTEILLTEFIFLFRQALLALKNTLT